MPPIKDRQRGRMMLNLSAISLIVFLFIGSTHGLPDPYSWERTNCSQYKWAEGLDKCMVTSINFLHRFKYDYSGLPTPYLAFCCEYPRLRKCIEEMLEERCESSVGSDAMIHDVLTKDYKYFPIGDETEDLLLNMNDVQCDGEEFYYQDFSPVCWPTWSIITIGILISIVIGLFFFLCCCWCYQLGI